MAGEEVEMLVTKLSLTTTRCLRGFPISQDIKVVSIRKSRVALLFLKTKFSLRSSGHGFVNVSQCHTEICEVRKDLLRKLFRPEIEVLCWHGRDSW